MRWFKHMTNASDDEFLSRLEAEMGLEAIARWWKMLEAIARQMDGSERCFATYPTAKWLQLLSEKREKSLRKFTDYCQLFGRISVEYSPNLIKIKCPKLLELRDEYSRKSGQTPDATPDKVAPEADTEKEPTPSGVGARDPALDFIKCFDDAISEVFGKESCRAFPAADDMVFAKRYYDAGATTAWFKAFCRERMQYQKQKGKQPPRSLNYFKDAVPEALSALAGLPKQAAIEQRTISKALSVSELNRRNEILQKFQSGTSA